jgi:hypothetical protein
MNICKGYYLSRVQNVQTRGKQKCVCQLGFEETLKMIILRPITTSDAHLTNPIRQDHHRILETYRGLKAMSWFLARMIRCS